MIVISIVKLILIDRLVIYVIADSPHDDLWVVSAAENILNGNWLGKYNQYTLIKGCFSPIFLAFCNIIGISFLKMTSIIYIISCFVFIFSIKPIIKKEIALCFIFTILIFNPITMSMETFQRVYRNGHSQWQILLIFSSFISLLLKKEELVFKDILWSILGGFSLWAFFNTREDSIIIMPFVIVSTCIILIFLLKKINKDIFVKIVIVLLPILILFLGNMFIKSVNNIYYGGYLLNDRTYGYFSNFIKDLYKIKPEDSLTEKYTNKSLPYHKYNYNIYRDVINKAYSVSPTLSSARPMIEASISTWDGGEELVDGELNFDHIIFAIRDGVAELGEYESLYKSERFYKKVYLELEEAFVDGRLIKKDNNLYTNAGSISYDSLKDIFVKFPQIFRYILDLKGVGATYNNSLGNNHGIKKFIDITGDRAIFPEDIWVEISGWAFVDDKYGKNISIYFCGNEGEIIKKIEFNKSVDIYNYFLNKGYKSNNALNSRYNIRIENRDIKDIATMKFIDGNNKVLKHIKLSDSSSFDGDFRFHIDSIVSSNDISNYNTNLIRFTNRVNNVINIYRYFQNILFILSTISFFILLIKNLVNLFKKQKSKIKDILFIVILLGILLSLIEICLIMAYIDIVSFPIITYLYLSSCYVLLYMFIGLGLYNFYEMFNTYKSKGVKINENSIMLNNLE